MPSDHSTKYRRTRRHRSRQRARTQKRRQRGGADQPIATSLATWKAAVSANIEQKRSEGGIEFRISQLERFPLPSRSPEDTNGGEWQLTSERGERLGDIRDIAASVYIVLSPFIKSGNDNSKFFQSQISQRKAAGQDMDLVQYLETVESALQGTGAVNITDNNQYPLYIWYLAMSGQTEAIPQFIPEVPKQILPPVPEPMQQPPVAPLP